MRLMLDRLSPKPSKRSKGATPHFVAYPLESEGLTRAPVEAAQQTNWGSTHRETFSAKVWLLIKHAPALVTLFAQTPFVEAVASAPQQLTGPRPLRRAYGRPAQSIELDLQLTNATMTLAELQELRDCDVARRSNEHSGR
jgi:hypothetical protein